MQISITNPWNLGQREPGTIFTENAIFRDDSFYFLNVSHQNPIENGKGYHASKVVYFSRGQVFYQPARFSCKYCLDPYLFCEINFISTLCRPFKLTNLFVTGLLRSKLNARWGCGYFAQSQALLEMGNLSWGDSTRPATRGTDSWWLHGTFCGIWTQILLLHTILPAISIIQSDSAKSVL